jgi:hypothetical protein
VWSSARTIEIVSAIARSYNRGRGQGVQDARCDLRRAAARRSAGRLRRRRRVDFWDRGEPGSGDRPDLEAGLERPGVEGPKQHQDSGGGAAQYRVKGGDNSVQGFGQEAGRSDFEAAATALHDFLDARAEGNWAAACQYMSKSAVESLEQLAAQTKSPDESCGAILAKITNPAAKQLMVEEAAKADVGSLRAEGDRAFLVYTVGGKTILAMPMANEGGQWKVAGLASTPLN